MDKAISSEKYSRLIERFKAVRLEQGLSMRELGALINEPHTFVQKVESKEKRLDVLQFVQYSQALKLDPTELLKQLLI